MLNKFKIGHYTDIENGTGATVIIAEEGAVGGVSVRGSAPATRETDLLQSEKTVQKINGVVLSGGSAFGLECMSGVVRYLYDNGIGYDAGAYKVPIVTGACLYDIEYNNFAYPDVQNGYDMAKEAQVGNFGSGIIGVGGGSTASKVLGMASAVKTGIGVATYEMNGTEIAVIIGVNPLGDIVKNGKIISGAKAEDGTYLDCCKVMSCGGMTTEPTNTNTTIGCIITNAKLTKVEANVIADIAHDGYATSLSPSHTRFDGDAMFVMASGEKSIELNILTAIIPKLVEKAIHSSVIGTEAIKHRVPKLLYKVVQKMFK